jgi:hypothetical protein
MLSQFSFFLYFCVLHQNQPDDHGRNILVRRWISQIVSAALNRNTLRYKTQVNLPFFHHGSWVHFEGSFNGFGGGKNDTELG